MAYNTENSQNDNVLSLNKTEIHFSPRAARDHLWTNSEGLEVPSCYVSAFRPKQCQFLLSALANQWTQLFHRPSIRERNLTGNDDVSGNLSKIRV